MRISIILINGQQAVGNGAVYVKCFGKQIWMRQSNALPCDTHIDSIFRWTASTT